MKAQAAADLDAVARAKAIAEREEAAALAELRAADEQVEYWRERSWFARRLTTETSEATDRVAVSAVGSALESMDAL